MTSLSAHAKLLYFITIFCYSVISGGGSLLKILKCAEPTTGCLPLFWFRAESAGRILRSLPAFAKLTVLDKTADWYKVDFHGQQGWVSAHYVRPEGDC
ncbi:MAG: SH3 domain-containing protein [Chloroflexi bacterium]|nr:SH3 domain-containing protein [Chloroflexota bacterium]MYC54508.1 SH3 domain-containing protein [Chloroflexota bacterium]MYD38896.1 SH3 domain-containing protein [Chloroflexota bacterium]MYH65970.1 SH3 domain-containing protein [Chloroflexota bacterium]